MNKLQRFFLIFISMLLPFSPIAAASIAKTGPIATAAYWTSRQAKGDNVLLSASGIKQMNNSLRQHNSSLHVLDQYPAVMTADQVKQHILAAAQDFARENLPEEFNGANPLTQTEWQAVRKNCALDSLTNEQKLQYAVTTARTNLRLLPTATGWYSSPNDVNYDDLQGSALDPAQAVIVLALSQDRQFAFVETATYQGWAAIDHLAFTDRKTWSGYNQPKDFAVVTSHQTTLSIKGKSQLFQMGAVIPCTSRKNELSLWLPQADNHGRLVIHKTLISPNEELHHGFLPYTRNNLIKQAFRFLGDEYGWGGQNNSVDCSSFTQNVYRSFGIMIPRDADQQELALPVNVPLNGKTTAERYALVRQAVPGSLLFKPGHVMMLLGEDEHGTPIVIHSASSYFTFANGKGQKHYIRQVLVSDLTFQNSKGIQTIDGITSIGSIR